MLTVGMLEGRLLDEPSLLEQLADACEQLLKTIPTDRPADKNKLKPWREKWRGFYEACTDPGGIRAEIRQSLLVSELGRFSSAVSRLQSHLGLGYDWRKTPPIVRECLSVLCPILRAAKARDQRRRSREAEVDTGKGAGALPQDSGEGRRQSGRLVELHEIDEFSLVEAISRKDISDEMVAHVQALDERTELEPFVQEILSDPDRTPHAG